MDKYLEIYAILVNCVEVTRWYLAQQLKMSANLFSFPISATIAAKIGSRLTLGLENEKYLLTDIICPYRLTISSQVAETENRLARFAKYATIN